MKVKHLVGIVALSIVFGIVVVRHHQQQEANDLHEWKGRLKLVGDDKDRICNQRLQTTKDSLDLARKQALQALKNKSAEVDVSKAKLVLAQREKEELQSIYDAVVKEKQKLRTQLDEKTRDLSEKSTELDTKERELDDQSKKVKKLMEEARKKELEITEKDSQIKEQEAQLKNKENQIKAHQKEIDEHKKHKDDLANSHHRTKQKLNEHFSQVNEIKLKMADLQVELERIESEIKA